MIPDKIKAQAIAKIRHRVPVEQIAEELNVPVKLVKEWGNNLDPKDLIAIQSNIHAVDEVLNGELIGLNEDKLRETLELAAIDIAKHASTPALNADVVHAKALQLCADAISKLYQTLIMKGGTGEPVKNTSGNFSTFQRLMKD